MAVISAEGGEKSRTLLSPYTEGAIERLCATSIALRQIPIWDRQRFDLEGFVVDRRSGDGSAATTFRTLTLFARWQRETEKGGAGAPPAARASTVVGVHVVTVAGGAAGNEREGAPRRDARQLKLSSTHEETTSDWDREQPRKRPVRLVGGAVSREAAGGRDRPAPALRSSCLPAAFPRAWACAAWHALTGARLRGGVRARH